MNRTRTLYFVGVTTGKSSILKVFPRWSEALGIDARIQGIDIAPNSPADAYRAAIRQIRDDQSARGALITTHKLNVFEHARDLFDDLDSYARQLSEINSVSKPNGKLVGHAKDPLTVGYSLEDILDATYWRRTGGHMLVLGAGGSALALTLYLHNKQQAGGDVPARIIVTARRQVRLDEMAALHRRIGVAIPMEYVLTEQPEQADRLVTGLPEHSMVINATGLGKDGPGSPITSAARFPLHGVVWEFNYRGDLLFLEQARAQQATRDLRIVDGWVYFVHGWTRVIAEVFGIDIPTHGPEFDRLSQIAIDATNGG